MRFFHRIALFSSLALLAANARGQVIGEEAATFRPERALSASSYTQGLPIQPLPTNAPLQMVRPPSRIGAPMAAQVPVGRLRGTAAMGEDEEHLASLDYDSRLAFSLFDGPESVFFDNLQFLNRLRLSLETGPQSSFQVDVLDRWDLARDLLARAPDPHFPEIRRLLWQWNASGGACGFTLGRQRLTTSGNRSIGSFSWLPDMQVFDGVRLDLGREKDFGRFSFGAFIDQAFVTPFHAGPSLEEEPFLLAAWSWSEAAIGTCRAHARFNPGNENAPWLGASWESPPGKRKDPTSYRLDALALADAGQEESPPWHLSVHRQKRAWGLHAGAERIAADDLGRHVSATPGTFRYLPSGIEDDTLNLFLGLDYRLHQGALASLTLQHLEAGDDGTADVIEAAIRHPISPSAALLAGAGCGREHESGDLILRTGVQLLAVF
jgi:hypothetical protein